MANYEKFGSKYGTDFEEKILYYLITDNKFLSRIIHILQDGFFQAKHHRYIVKIIKEHWYKKSKAPSHTLFKIRLKSAKDKIAQKQAVGLLIKLFTEDCQDMIDDYEEIQEEVVNYCRQQNWRLKMQSALDHIDEFKFDQAQAVMEQSFYEGMETNLGLEYEDTDDRLVNMPRKDIIPTPWEPLNKRIGGGLGKGELFVIVAPMGTGKTHIATNLAVYGKKSGFDVIIYSLEQSKEYNRMRMDSLLLGKDIKDDEIKNHIPEIKEYLAKYDVGRIRIQRLPSGSTANDIKNDIRLHRAIQFHPKLVIIDYLDLMEPINNYDKKKQMWDKLEVVTKEVRDIVCSECDVAGCGLAQGNTNSMELKAIWAQNTSGGVKRLHPADIIGGYARNVDMKEAEQANFTMIKNRFGKDGFLIPVTTDYSFSKIEFQDKEVYGEAEKNEKEIKHEMANGFKDFVHNYEKKKLN